MRQALAATDRPAPQARPAPAPERPALEPARPTGYLVEQRLQAGDPLGAAIHTAHCRQTERETRAITADEARQALAGDPKFFRACDFCQPGKALSGWSRAAAEPPVGSREERRALPPGDRQGPTGTTWGGGTRAHHAPQTSQPDRSRPKVFGPAGSVVLRCSHCSRTASPDASTDSTKSRPPHPSCRYVGGLATPWGQHEIRLGTPHPGIRRSHARSRRKRPPIFEERWRVRCPQQLQHQHWNPGRRLASPLHRAPWARHQILLPASLAWQQAPARRRQTALGTLTAKVPPPCEGGRPINLARRCDHRPHREHGSPLPRCCASARDTGSTG
ncbi:DUF6233 domain-containing protein [Streptomyces albidocamelliae]|uniref:DUF6233 domain-containing protein n=1 Tax=Streptomyces albidocamelliae TaxID=2981135 RepID=UPI00384D499D